MDPQVGDLRGGRGRGRRRGAAYYGNGVVRAFVGFREKLKRIVESKYFNRGIMIAILVNTLSMGIEYHEQVSSPGGKPEGGWRLPCYTSNSTSRFLAYRSATLTRLIIHK